MDKKKEKIDGRKIRLDFEACCDERINSILMQFENVI